MNITDAWLRQTDAEAHATRGADLPGCMYRRAAVWGYAAACAVVLTVAVRHILYYEGCLSCGACLLPSLRPELSGGTARRSPTACYTRCTMLAAVCAIISDTLPFIQTTRFTLLIGLQNNICPSTPKQSWVVGHVLCLSLNLVLQSKAAKERKLETTGITLKQQRAVVLLLK